MGLLDKVDNISEEEPKKAKKATKASQKKPVEKKAARKKAKPAKVAKKKTTREKAARPERIRPRGLPEGYELAGKMPRYIGWLINFAFNFGVLIGTLSVFLFGDPDLTIGFAVAALMIIVNWLVIPIWTGRNIGEFVSRTKYINASGNKPLFIHAILNNSLGYLFLLGFIFVGTNFQLISTTSGMTYVIVGALFMITWVVNFFFKKNSDYSQGLFDLAFSSYLVKHMSVGNETGWLARFESLGDFGDKWQEKQAQRQEKAKAKAEKRANEAAEKEKAEKIDENKSEDNTPVSE